MVLPKTIGPRPDIWGGQVMIEPVPCDLSVKVCLTTGVSGDIGEIAVAPFTAFYNIMCATDVDHNFGSLATYQQFDLLIARGLIGSPDWIVKDTPDVLFNNQEMFRISNILAGRYFKQLGCQSGINMLALYPLINAGAQSAAVNNQQESSINHKSQTRYRNSALVAHNNATKTPVIISTQTIESTILPCKIRINSTGPTINDTLLWKTIGMLFTDFDGKKFGQKRLGASEAAPLYLMSHPSSVESADVFPASTRFSDLTAQTIRVDGENVLR